MAFETSRLGAGRAPVARAGRGARGRAAVLASAGCAAVIALAGCGGGGQSTTSTSAAAAVGSARALRILASAEAAIDRVHSFHLTATGMVAGKSLSVSGAFELPGRADIIERYGAGTIELRAIGGTVYFRANAGYYEAEGVTGAQLARVNDRWVSATSAQIPTLGAFIALTKPATLGLCMLRQRLGTLSVAGEASVGGRQATVLADAGDRPGSAPGRIYVAASGTPLPLRITVGGSYRSGGTTDAACDNGATAPGEVGTDELISGFNAPLTIAAPAGALSLASLAAPAPATTGVAAAPVRTVETTLGRVGYRMVGSGPALVLITGYGGTMESWEPALVNGLSKHHRVVIFDNAGIGKTQSLPAPLTIDAMADQTSALIVALRLGKPDVLGWSMGGMIAQALAIRHPSQVSRLVLCATFPGSGKDAVPSQKVINALNAGGQAALNDLFPADQAKAAAAFVAGTATYPSSASAPAATVAAQAQAIIEWWDDRDPAGRQTASIAVPTLVADGTVDRVDPVSNDRALARLIPGAKLQLYPDAGHAFLFQDESSFVALVESFLG
jgi:pimeloyl-ACP methyl ester carboxylesterase